MKYIIISLLFTVLVLAACKVKSKSNQSTNETPTNTTDKTTGKNGTPITKPKVNNDGRKYPCDTYGTVIDHTGLDGCTFLIHTDNGQKLLPTKLPKGFVLKDKQRIAFAYRNAPNGAGICMAEDKIVEILCIEEIEESGCIDTKDPMSIPWMSNLIKKMDADLVIKYQYNEKPVYFFKITRCCDFQNFLYDCEGNKICTDGGFTGGNCHSILKKVKNEELVWHKEK